MTYQHYIDLLYACDRDKRVRVQPEVANAWAHLVEASRLSIPDHVENAAESIMLTRARGIVFA